MRRMLLLIVAGLVVSTARDACAASACGVLLTNVASATYRTTGGAPAVVEYNVTATVLVETPEIFVDKSGTPTLQAPGGIVTFCISFTNLSACGSAANVVVRDEVPSNMAFMSMMFVKGPAGSTPTMEWSSDDSSWNTVGAWPIAGSTPIFLRWSFDVVGMGKSGYICWRASVL